jgi:RNA polymerase primary sigma factor
LIKLSETIGARKFDQELLESLISLLNEREKSCLVLRFGLSGEEPMTLDNIGKNLKISKERVRQCEATAFKKLRGFLT